MVHYRLSGCGTLQVVRLWYTGCQAVVHYRLSGCGTLQVVRLWYTAGCRAAVALSGQQSFCQPEVTPEVVVELACLQNMFSLTYCPSDRSGVVTD